MATILDEAPAELGYDEFVDTEHYEIIDGEKVEMPPMSADSQFIASQIAYHLNDFGRRASIGTAVTEVLIKLVLPFDRNRKPDVVFVPFSQWPGGRLPPATNAWDVLPSVCIEVVSPSDTADEIETKRGEYLAAGIRSVWVVYPRHGRIYVHERSDAVRVVQRADTLDGGEVLPGFRLPLAELFPAQS